MSLNINLPAGATWTTLYWFCDTPLLSLIGHVRLLCPVTCGHCAIFHCVVHYSTLYHAILTAPGLQIAYPWLVNHDTGFSLPAVFLHHATNGLRVIDPIADAVLGIRLLLPTSDDACPFQGGNNCSAHVLIGTIVTIAALLDFMLGMIALHDSKWFLGWLGSNARKVLNSLFCVCYAGEIGV